MSTTEISPLQKAIAAFQALDPPEPPSFAWFGFLSDSPLEHFSEDAGALEPKDANALLDVMGTRGLGVVARELREEEGEKLDSDWIDLLAPWAGKLDQQHLLPAYIRSIEIKHADPRKAEIHDGLAGDDGIAALVATVNDRRPEDARVLTLAAYLVAPNLGAAPQDTSLTIDPKLAVAAYQLCEAVAANSSPAAGEKLLNAFSANAVDMLNAESLIALAEVMPPSIRKDMASRLLQRTEPNQPGLAFWAVYGKKRAYEAASALEGGREFGGPPAFGRLAPHAKDWTTPARLSLIKNWSPAALAGPWSSFGQQRETVEFAMWVEANIRARPERAEQMLLAAVNGIDFSSPKLGAACARAFYTSLQETSNRKLLVQVLTQQTRPNDGFMAAFDRLISPEQGASHGKQ